MLLLRRPQPPLPGPLVLPDGSSVRLVAVTYGTNHVVGPPLARLAAHLPPWPQALLIRVFGQRAQALHSTTTPTPALVVWLERTAPNSSALTSGHLETLLSDRSGFISGEAAYYSALPAVEPLRFWVFPRREGAFALEFFYHDAQGQVKGCGRLPLANPLRGGQFPQWQPEPLPATHRAGDVEVTLEQLSTGQNNNLSLVALPGGRREMGLGTNRPDGRNRTYCLVRVRSLAHTNEVWQVAGEEVSDATGNRVSNTSISWGSPMDHYFGFEPGLWPSEAAWKLKCELKRTKGFAPGELFTFQGVPLGAVSTTNTTLTRLGWTTNVGGLAITLREVRRRPPLTNDSSWSSSQLSGCTLTVVGLTNGQHLDLTSARTDTGTNLEAVSWSSSGTEREYYFRSLPLEARTADFTFAVQQARWVEFTVKPQVGVTRLKLTNDAKGR